MAGPHVLGCGYLPRPQWGVTWKYFEIREDCMDRAPTISEIIDQRPLIVFQITTMVLCGTVIVLDGFDTQSI
jgi:hypothetical protein